MRTVNFFVASSVVEFEKERQLLGDFVLDLNGVFRDRGVQFDWRKPEHMSISMSRHGSQTDFDRKVRESQFFFMLVGHKLGEFTEREFDIAWEQQEKTGFPIIVPFFLSRAGDWPSESAVKFRNRLKELGYYPDRATFPDMGQIKLALLMELERSGLLNGETPEEADEQQDADRALERIAARIRDNNAKADALKEQGLTWDGTIPQMVKLYEENVHLVKKYHVEPDAVYWYADFLYKQHSYPEAIALLDWLGQLYAVKPPEQETEARRKHLLGTCYHKSNHFEQGEQNYKEALEIRRRLAEANPAAYEPDVALTCNNLGNLLSDTNRMEEAERYYTEALEIRRRLAEANPAAYEPDVAGTCNNLGILLKDTHRMEEAERYYTEALEIRRRQAEANPAAYEVNVALVGENLADLMMDTNREKEAEALY
ncbi:MAG: tetratricopeptide repeat protein, partial [Oscillibacter sp.]|nr:tetratricopeptide repeat protein [Oscillibacter sp.]